MKLFNVVMLFFLIALLASCSKADFSVKAPEGWVVVDTVSESYGRFVKMHPPVKSITPVFVENVIISIVNFPSVDLYIKSLTSGMKENGNHFLEIAKGTVEIDKKEAQWEQHIIRQKHSEMEIEQKAYFIKDYGNIYQIVCSTEASQMEKFQVTIDAILKSFKIL